MKRILLLLALAGGLTGCSTDGLREKEPLRVGITPNYPPLIYRQDGKLAGLEYDLMRKLGRELGRPVIAVLIPWDEQMDELVAGKTDIIMSGMSVTKARKVKIGFTDPWMRGGLMAMMRKADATSITSAVQVASFTGNIGVLANTTSDDWVRRSCPSARVIKIASANDAAVQLRRKTIDLFVHDIPSIAWQVASDESDMTALLEPLDREEIAWGVRRDDTELTAQINQIIQRWRDDGSLEASIIKWIPYYNRIK